MSQPAFSLSPRHWWFALFLALLTPAWAQADARLELFDASGRLLYLGRFQERVHGQKLERTIRYCRADGRPVLETTATLQASTRRLLTTRTIDRRTGREKSVEVTAEGVVLALRPEAKAELSTDVIAVPDALLVPESLGDLVRAHWDTLAKGGVVEVDLALPEIGDTMRFRVLRDHDDEQAMVVRFEPASWVIRRLADTVLLRFELAAPHRLIGSEGPSAVRDDDGELQNLKVVCTPAETRALPCGNAK